MCDADENLSRGTRNGGTDSDAPATPAFAASRRSLLKTTVALGGAAFTAGALGQTTVASAQAAAATPSGDRLVMLGVGGGPVVAPGQAKPALALVANGRVYLIDAGLDTTRQLVASGLGFGDVKHVFITHQHLDHTSGLPDLVLHGWAGGRPPLTSLDLWGPPGMSRKIAGIRTTFGEDINLFTAGGIIPVFPALKAHDVSLSATRRITRVMEDDNVAVDATRVFHGPEVKDAYAYRFTLKHTSKTVVFSGDTAAPDQNLIALAQGCDVLVHEAQDNTAVDRVAASYPPAQGEALRKHLYRSHSDVLDLPAVAKAARAKKLVLNHYTPVVHPAATWLAIIRPAAEKAGYTGQILAPMDLDTITL
ncbi:MBL fold metallo-hydrolase [Kocuria sp. NPDC057446]|uniref:MBL fold metallo-hydrolase n=1 Tax=Kocuria sp. NPDC057446 TaxID=3346137 RepID=UPI0036B1865A